jgi:hypothetical protein
MEAPGSHLDGLLPMKTKLMAFEGLLIRSVPDGAGRGDGQIVSHEKSVTIEGSIVPVHVGQDPKASLKVLINCRTLLHK